MRSASHANQTHVLTLAQTDHVWRAFWLKISEVEPPKSMLFEFINIHSDRLNNAQLHSGSKKERFSYCKKVWQVAENLKNRRHTHNNWEDEFLQEHKNCPDTKCREQIRQKCLWQGRNILGNRLLLTHCIFPVKMSNFLNFSQKRPTNKWRKCRSKKCLKRKRKQCEIKLSGRKPHWTPLKVSQKCQFVYRIESCIMRRLGRHRSNSKRRFWSQKKQRSICKKRILRKMDAASG